MFKSVLVVCTGNICRSPTGERIFRALMPEKTIDSAGTHTPGLRAADASALRIAATHGISLDAHISRQLTPEMAARYDLILVMEKNHIAQVISIAPLARSKTMLLGHWLNGVDIPDPWRKSDEAFGHVYQLIHQACLTWVSKLGE